MRDVFQSPTEKKFVQNPYPIYDKWRDENFVFWNEYKIPVSAKYQIVNTLLRDKRFGREAPKGLAKKHTEHLKPFYEFESRSILEREPPTHTRIRGQILRAFTSRRINELTPEIDALCHKLIDDLPGDQFDLLPHFAEKIPVIIIARLIGVDEIYCDQLLNWSHDMVAMYQANRSPEIEAAAVLATQKFSDFIKSLIEEKREKPQDDLISQLISVEGEKLSLDEIVTTVILLLNAGHEATVHSIGNAVKNLLETKQNVTEENIDGIIEETLRFDPPLHMFTRYAMDDVEIFGHKFSKGDQLGLLLGAANRDPEKYPDPNIFDHNRGASDHTSFGAGIHFCIGAPLARRELSAALRVLFERLPNIKIAQKPIYADRYHFHGLEELWLKT